MNYSAPIEVSELAHLERFGISRVVAAIGVFDGIHLGHRAIIEKLLAVSEEYDAIPVVITFHPHPRHFLIHESALKLLHSRKSKIELLGQLGVKAVVVVDFTREIAEMEPESFVDFLIKNKNVKLSSVCIGENWKFGSKAKGDVGLLEKLSMPKGYKLHVVKYVFIDGIPISSTRIRREISEAKFGIAYKMLGCDYKMEGRVLTSHPSVKCIVDYGIIPHHPGKYGIVLFAGAQVISAYAVIDQQNIKENSFSIETEDILNLGKEFPVKIFFKP